MVVFWSLCMHKHRASSYMRARTMFFLDSLNMACFIRSLMVWTTYWSACTQGCEDIELGHLRKEQNGDRELGGMSSEDCSTEQRLCKSPVGSIVQGLMTEDTAVSSFSKAAFNTWGWTIKSFVFYNKMEQLLWSLNTLSLCITPTPLLHYIQEDRDKEI